MPAINIHSTYVCLIRFFSYAHTRMCVRMRHVCERKKRRKKIKIFDTFASEISPRSQIYSVMRASKFKIMHHFTLKPLLFRLFPLNFFPAAIAYLDLNRKNAHTHTCTRIETVDCFLLIAIRHVQMRLWTFHFQPTKIL